MLNLDPLVLIARVLTLVISLCVHEFSHAWVASRFGDNTARAAGRLTLNPLAHLDPIGSILLLVAGFGWAKPVPVNPYYMRSRSGLMWTSLAGPMSNFILAAIAIIPLRFDLLPADMLYGSGFLPTFFEQFIIINLSLMLFNLLPLAPLDGEKIAAYAWPPAWAAVLERFQRFGPIILMFLFVSGSFLPVDIIGSIITPPLMNILRLLMGAPLV